MRAALIIRWHPPDSSTIIGRMNLKGTKNTRLRPQSFCRGSCAAYHAHARQEISEALTSSTKAPVGISANIYIQGILNHMAAIKPGIVLRALDELSSKNHHQIIPMLKKLELLFPSHIMCRLWLYAAWKSKTAHIARFALGYCKQSNQPISEYLKLIIISSDAKGGMAVFLLECLKYLNSSGLMSVQLASSFLRNAIETDNILQALLFIDSLQCVENFQAEILHEFTALLIATDTISESAIDWAIAKGHGYLLENYLVYIAGERIQINDALLNWAISPTRVNQANASIVIPALIRQNQQRDAEIYFKKVKKCLSSEVYEICILECCVRRDLEGGLLWYSRLRQNNHAVNTNILLRLLEVASKLRDNERTVFYFLEISKCGHEPDDQAYEFLLAVYESFNSVAILSAIMSEMISRKITFTTGACKSIIAVFMNNGLAADAQRLFSKLLGQEAALNYMLSKYRDGKLVNIPPGIMNCSKDIISIFNSFISGYNKMGDHQSALHYLGALHAIGVEPSSATLQSFTQYFGRKRDFQSLVRWWDPFSQSKQRNDNTLNASFIAAVANSSPHVFKNDILMDVFGINDLAITSQLCIAMMLGYLNASRNSQVFVVWKQFLQTKCSPNQLAYMLSAEFNIAFCIYLDASLSAIEVDCEPSKEIIASVREAAMTAIGQKNVIDAFSWYKLRYIFTVTQSLDAYLDILEIAIIQGQPSFSNNGTGYTKRPNSYYTMINDSFSGLSVDQGPSCDPVSLYDLRSTLYTLKHIRHKERLNRFYRILCTNFISRQSQDREMRSLLVKMRRILHTYGYTRVH